ncbi:PRC-barrel domain-containing protein [Polaribacter vadi]|jgi:hypothetical protein|uniref:PRC-barrel domain-containing protein n=1 Tax=Polaribacter vadi TaxID=1774273 RepID=UPI0030ECF47E|tara:strand:+ start:38719 stop:39225 length:507 start_codon:yes stop_codon:yes gene_type:complete
MNTNKENKTLFYLEELGDYKVADDQKDVRGWKVKDIDNRVIGEVNSLLVNKNTERVVYLDVELDETILNVNHEPFSAKAKDGIHEFVNEDGENHVIIPIGLANLDLDNKVVSTTSINSDTFSKTKRFKKDSPIYRDYETLILRTYTRPEDVVNYPEDDLFYEQNEFNS